MKKKSLFEFPAKEIKTNEINVQKSKFIGKSIRNYEY